MYREAKKREKVFYRSSENQLKNLELGRQARRKFDEPKTVQWNVRLTQTGKEGLFAIAKEHGLNPSDLIELLSRGEFELVRKAS